jgi:putative thioredoxin
LNQDESEEIMIDVADFEQDVLAASHEKPVLVDFWAPWCGPCRQLGPILEKLSEEEGAGFTLAKLNTDENQAVAVQFGIQSIPAVKLFVDGQVVDEFIGALPEREVRQWLAQAVPSETRRLVEDARAAFDAGARDDAEALLEEAVAAEPSNAEAALLLAKLVLFKDPARAEALSHTPSADYADAEAVETVVRLLQKGAEPDLPQSAGRDAYVHAVEALGRGEIDAALGGFVDSVRRDRHFHDDVSRRTLLHLFNVLGDRHELTRKHRRGLEMALF